MPRHFLLFICCFAFLSRVLIAGYTIDSGNLLRAMETSSLDQELKRILGDYYLDSYGGSKTWAKLQSLQTIGEIFINNTKIPFIAYKKKPNLCKIIFNPMSEKRYLQAFDGHNAWEWNTHASDGPSLMTEKNARSFIASSGMGDELLFPQLSTKKIVFTGSRLLENGQLVRDIQVTLAGDVSITYSIDVRQSILLEETQNYSSEDRIERMVYSDHRTIDGVQVAFRNDVYLNEKLSHSIRFRQVQFNAGLISWMFTMPRVDSLMETAPGGSTRFEFELNSESLFLDGGLLDQLKSIPANSITEYNESMEYFTLPVEIKSVPKTGTPEN